MPDRRDTQTEYANHVLGRLVALAPSDKELRLRLADELFRTGRSEEALDQIQIVLGLDPNNLKARELRMAIREVAVAAGTANSQLAADKKNLSGHGP